MLAAVRLTTQAAEFVAFVDRHASDGRAEAATDVEGGLASS